MREKPRQIYNCDESVFCSDQSRHKVLAHRRAKHVYQQAPGTKEYITVLACCNTAGEDIPPKPCMEGPTVATLTGTSFRKWFQHFIKHAVKERPLLLLFNGHRSHMDPEVLRAALGEGVMLLCLPPHTPMSCSIWT